MSGYDVAQVCMNGHIVNEAAHRWGESNQKHCRRCGAATITACPSCNASIRGRYFSDGVIDMTTHHYVLKYCHNCGTPYPWTVSSLEAAKELIADSELSDEDKEKLQDSLPDLVAESPKTQVAVGRYKRLVKVGSALGDGLQKVLVNVVSEVIKKQMFGV